MVSIVLMSGGLNLGYTQSAEAWLQGFNRMQEAVVATQHDPSPARPFGTPHPEAPAELEQFAFLIGAFRCESEAPGINPHDPATPVTLKTLWRASYALDGRAIRDERIALGSVASNMRIFDAERNEWLIVFANAAPPVAFHQGPQVMGGTLAARQEGDAMVTRTETTADDGSLLTSVTRFDAITSDGFTWSTQTLQGDTPVYGLTMACVRTE